jgi:methylmalonyl-CoA mutase
MKLFTEFSPATAEEWIAEALKSIKQTDIELIRTPTDEKITLQPFYTAQDIHQSFVSPTDFNFKDWQNREYIEVSDITLANKLAINALQKGSDSIYFDISKTNTLNIPDLIKDIPEKTKLNFKLPPDFKNLLPQLAQLKAGGQLSMDFINDWAQIGELPTQAWEKLINLIEFAETHLQWKVLSIDGSIFLNAGANAVQELAFTFTKLIEYVDKLTQKGISAGQVLSQVEVTMAVGSNYFMEIAKLRAVRVLWRQVLLAFQVPFQPLSLYAITCTWNKTLKDAYNNMLRATTEAMAGIIGGADALTILPYNHFFTEADEFSTRIARNVSTILKEESHLNKVKDASSGTYFIEKLTAELALNAWTLLQTIEQKGGFSESFRQNYIQELISEEAARKKADLEAKKRILVGTNKYENKAEKLNITPQVQTEAFSKEGFKLLRISRLAEGLEG